jgi:hypothetical protein
MGSGSLSEPTVVSPGIEPGGIVFPSQNKNIVFYLFDVLQTMWELEIFSSARVSFDDPLRVLLTVRFQSLD